MRKLMKQEENTKKLKNKKSITKPIFKIWLSKSNEWKRKPCYIKCRWVNGSFLMKITDLCCSVIFHKNNCNTFEV